MKAFIATDRNGDEGVSLVVFAETAGKAKAYATGTDEFCDYGFTGIRVNRCKALDSCYKGKSEMDWLNADDRIAMLTLPTAKSYHLAAYIPIAKARGFTPRFGKARGLPLWTRIRMHGRERLSRIRVLRHGEGGG